MLSSYWKPISIAIVFSIIVSIHGRPNVRYAQDLKQDRAADSAQIIEHKSIDDDDAPTKSLPYYGGAKGKFLLIHPSGRTSITNRNPSFYGIRGDVDDEEDVGMEEENSDENESNTSMNSTAGSSTPEESVCVGLPPDNASVAEAKPVGLAVAGPGGVAASKPVGTAVSGPGGLSVARPVATAIAGVAGAESLVGLSPVKKRNERPIKNSTPVISATNKTKEEGTLTAKRSFEHETEIQLSDSVPDGHKVYYIPVYLPDDASSREGRNDI